MKDAILAIIDKLYGNSDQLHTIRSLSTNVADPEGSRYYDWTARVNVKQYAVGTSFSVLLFLGDVHHDPASWQTGRCETFAGAVDAFVNSSAEQCANCRNQREDELVIEGFVHLNRAIARLAPDFESLHPDVVKPWLQKNLTWRVQKVGSSVRRILAFMSCFVCGFSPRKDTDDGVVGRWYNGGCSHCPFAPGDGRSDTTHPSTRNGLPSEG